MLRSKYCKEQSKENGVEVVHQFCFAAILFRWATTACTL